ncbi:hypothetical protein [Candidatus Mesenet endosymbiont of Agriotes lineatus]|uniref:hypothetical protein n=1 Tax=Candidatus Mesenet endosymbiont of Agriotes lineatus TaxID=3077948 RepID=UPI0030CD882F
MKKEEVEKLQQELIGIISCIPSSGEDSSEKDRALEIIQALGCDHINGIISYGSKKGTILDCIIEFDSTPEPNRTITMWDNTLTWSNHRIRLNNKTLVELEKSVESFGGKKSEALRSPLDKIISKAKHEAIIAACAVAIVFIVVGVIVGMMLAIIGATVGAAIGTIIGIGSEIKTGINSLASKIKPNLQNITVELINVNQGSPDTSINATPS